MDAVIKMLGKGNKYVCSSCLLLMVLIIFANTAMRYLFKSSIIMAEELTRYLFIWSIFLAVISVYYERRHIAVTTVLDKLSPRTLALFNFVTNFGALYALGILLQGSLMYFSETTTMGQVTGIPYKLAVAPVILASVCCLCIVATDMLRNWRIWRTGIIPPVAE